MMLFRGSQSMGLMDRPVVSNLSACTQMVLFSAAGKHRRLFRVLRVHNAEFEICTLYDTCFQRNCESLHEEVGL